MTIPMTPPDFIPKQNSDLWLKARSGKVTASRFKDISMSKAGYGFGEAAKSYCFEIVGQRFRLEDPNWVPEPSLKIHAIEHGNTWEPFARASYAWLTGANVVPYGFVEHPRIAGVGGSPDGVIADEPGIIEIKCPAVKEHVRLMATGTVPKTYIPQVQGNLAITGREWCDFVSHYPFVSEELMTHVVRVYRDDKYIEKLEARLERFGEFIDQTERVIRDGDRKQPGTMGQG